MENEIKYVEVLIQGWTDNDPDTLVVGVYDSEDKVIEAIIKREGKDYDPNCLDEEYHEYTNDDWLIARWYTWRKVQMNRMVFD